MNEFKNRLTEFYNKFNENKRLDRRHGQVEFITSIRYLEEYLQKGDRIVDIGAGPGRYSLYFKNKGYDVTAVEYVRPNIGMLKAKDKDIRVVEASATDLSMFEDNEFDVAIMFGPLYHLYRKEDKLKALNEARRITKKGGFILAGYVMSDYAVVKYGFMEGNIRDSLAKKALTDDYGIISDEEELYDYARLCDINDLNEKAGLKRKYIFAPDGPADYIRNVLNEMDEETFELFIDYQIKNSRRPDILGASSHTVDVLHIEK